jgi:hypothetical protein
MRVCSALMLKKMVHDAERVVHTIVAVLAQCVTESSTFDHCSFRETKIKVVERAMASFTLSSATLSTCMQPGYLHVQADRMISKLLLLNSSSNNNINNNSLFSPA